MRSSSRLCSVAPLTLALPPDPTTLARTIRGTFKRIRENKDLRFTWVGETGDESLVDVVLTDKGGGKTGLLVNHDRLQTKAEADGIRRAWSEAIDRMKKHLESK